MDLTISTRGGSNPVVVDLVGEIDAFTAAPLRDRLLNVVARRGTDLVLDFSGVSFLDSAGINALVSVRRRLLLLGGSLRLASVQPAPERVLQVCGLDRVFPMHPSVEEAVAATEAASTSRGTGASATPTGSSLRLLPPRAEQPDLV